MADSSGDNVNWTLSGQIPNGPGMAATGKIEVDSYNVYNITVPPKGKATKNLSPIDGVVSLILVKAADNKSYQYLTYALDDSHDQIPFENGALMLLGGVIKLITFPKSITIWYNPEDPDPCATSGKAPAGASVTILIGSKTS